MQIFITGGTGLVGSATIRSLLSSQHASSGFKIRALARSANAAQKITSLGATPVHGDISDLDLLAKEGADADAVVYCAFDHSGDFSEQIPLEAKAVTALCKALSTSPSRFHNGAKKMLLFCTGVMYFPSAPTANEDTPCHNKTNRAGTDAAVEQYSLSPPEGAGIRGVQIRLPMVTHISSQIHMFVRMLHKGDHITYYKDGSNKWPAGAASDVGDLLAKVLEHQDRIPNDKFSAVHSWSEWVSTKEVARAIKENAGLPVKPMSEEEYDKLDFFSKRVLAASPSLDNAWTKETFGWTPSGNTLLQEFKEGKYYQEGGIN